jgi:uncharacterized protein YegP (UPF0339 family)
MKWWKKKIRKWLGKPNNYKFHIAQQKNNDWYFTFIGPSGEVKVVSEGVRNKNTILEIIELLQETADIAAIVE